MIALDTNVLVRFVVQDDPAQSEAAAKIIMAKCSADEPGFIGQIVLCELVWVLERGYGCDRKTIASVVRRILSVPELRVENADVAWRALRSFEQGKAGYADYLIGHSSRENGAEITNTFDQRASDGFLFKLVKIQ